MVTTKLRNHAGVDWPPRAASVAGAHLSGPTPGPNTHAGFLLMEVCRLTQQDPWIDLRFTLHGQTDQLRLYVTDISLRKPVARFLGNHKYKTIMELGNMDVDF